ncbi:hypothetical protein F511_23913 [Dorcoceras hygrometricum]|uniref:Uncharacterized protein n=1 Tax=Dorcoceras hygrometricum TaxID=472368 RepID=A0A2Z7B8I2_9LAMI|nr:hypothetical protein F511_23913 [Dorcoceras hygrometricum]
MNRPGPTEPAKSVQLNHPVQATTLQLTHAVASCDTPDFSSLVLFAPATMVGAPSAGPPQCLAGSNGTNHGPNREPQRPHDGWEHAACTRCKVMRHPCVVRGSVDASRLWTPYRLV